MTELRHEQCQTYLKGSPALPAAAIQQLLQFIPRWQLAADSKSISREFRFQNFPETIAFVNAVAWIAQQQDHHPRIQIDYQRCEIRYVTHSVAGLSRNDFICAAKIDNLQQ